ncbi:MAG: hypothetical protein QOG43_1240 [Actinomycetota bacterium]|jgi:hypothetical protein|nr:hypothetical protein [Actinomycetota bacterium]
MDESEPISDAKLVFYLERRKQIDEWAKLVEVEKVVAHQFMLSLQRDIIELARVQDPEIGVDHLVLDSEQLIAMWRPSWLPTDATARTPIPRAMIAIGWWRSVRFEASNAPWVGLRMGTSRDDLRPVIGPWAAGAAITKGAFPAGNPVGKGVWVRYGSVPVTTARYWEDLRPYRTALVNAVSDAWGVFADVVDAALQHQSDDTIMRREDTPPWSKQPEDLDN